MNVLIAPDCFTGTLTAPEAADAMARGWLRSDPAAAIDLAPMSDGGPGFLDAVARGVPGTAVPVLVRGPLGGPAPAHVFVADDGTAYVESAQACGTALLPPGGLAPMDAGTVGVGELLAAALDAGARRVVVGIGGTASTDGGEGAVRALGGRWPADVELLVASDVDNPLLGGNGAAAVYGPQKGADPRQVVELEERLRDWVARSSRPDRPELAKAPGAGAGGGLGYGLMLLGGRRTSGVQTVLEALRLPERAEKVDLLLTGEGSFDATSLQGKVVKGVAWVAQRSGRPCVVLAGRVMVGRREFAAAGVDAAYSVVDLAGSTAAALADPADRLADLAERVARSWVPR
jgi:glycerate kinase